jgi:hypothetical protein
MGLPYVLGEEQRFVGTPVGGAVLAFMLMAIGAFVSGLSHGSLTSYLLRHFAEVLLSIALFYLVVNTVRDTGRLQRLMRWVVLGATAAAALGIGLYFLPDELAIQILSALGRFGYPTGSGVLWYIRDDPSLMQRATATSVHPNVLGSLLNVALAMAVPQLFTRRPFLPHWLLIGADGGDGPVPGTDRLAGFDGGPGGGSHGHCGAALSQTAALDGRRAAPLPGAAVDSNAGDAFCRGFLREDLSTQMRMGEYKDTFTLIARYPVLGWGSPARRTLTFTSPLPACTC